MLVHWLYLPEEHARSVSGKCPKWGPLQWVENAHKISCLSCILTTSCFLLSNCWSSSRKAIPVMYKTKTDRKKQVPSVVCLSTEIYCHLPLLTPFGFHVNINIDVCLILWLMLRCVFEVFFYFFYLTLRSSNQWSCGLVINVINWDLHVAAGGAPSSSSEVTCWLPADCTVLGVISLWEGTDSKLGSNTADGSVSVPVLCYHQQPCVQLRRTLTGALPTVCQSHLISFDILSPWCNLVAVCLAVNWFGAGLGICRGSVACWGLVTAGVKRASLWRKVSKTGSKACLFFLTQKFTLEIIKSPICLCVVNV